MSTNRNVLIVSNCPLLREGMRLLIKEIAFNVITTADEKSASSLITKYTPSVIVVDRPSAKAVRLDSLFRRIDYPVKVVIVGLDDDKLALYSLPTLYKATRENLVKLITENV